MGWAPDRWLGRQDTGGVGVESRQSDLGQSTVKSGHLVGTGAIAFKGVADALGFQFGIWVPLETASLQPEYASDPRQREDPLVEVTVHLISRSVQTAPWLYLLSCRSVTLTFNEI